MSLLGHVLNYAKAGRSIHPIKPGTKWPSGRWKQYQSKRADEELITRWFDHLEPLGLCIFTGEISGEMDDQGTVCGFEALDCDAPELVESVYELAEASGISDLLEKLPCESTPRGGRHWGWCCSEWGGNQPLARRLVESHGQKTIKPLLETRGEGGLIVVAPTPPGIHPDHPEHGYEMLSGSWTKIPIISPDERNSLLKLARSFNEYIPPSREFTKNYVHGPVVQGERPGDRLNEIADAQWWAALLERHGWSWCYQRADIHYWQRPGKGERDRGISATVGAVGNGIYVFSTSAFPFEPERRYSPFAALALLDYGGDFKAAAKALAPPRLVPQLTSPIPPEFATADHSDIDAVLAEAIESDIVLPNVTYGDVFNATLLINIYGHKLRYCREWGAWFIWKGTHWEKDRQDEIFDYARDALKSILNLAFDHEDEKLMKHIARSRSHRGLSNMLAQAATMSVRRLPEDFDTHEYLFNCRNGTIDLRDGCLYPHNPDLLITKCAPVDYEPDAECEQWKQFLFQVMGGSETGITPEDTEADMERKEAYAGKPTLDMMGFLQRAVGYSLYGSNQEKVLLIPWGTGDNGKTTFIETIADILGEGYAMRVATNVFLSKRNDNIPNDVAALLGIRFAYAAEPDQDRRLDAALIKELTGGDKVSARFMRGEYFQFRPVCTIWMCTNHRPPTRDTGKGLWSRIKLIPFTVSIPEKEQDRNLRAKLMTEAPGILAWAVRGCLEWQADGLQEPESVKAATSEYREENDTVGLFIAECCILHASASAKSSYLYEHYKRYCEQAGERALTNKSLSKALEEKGFRSRRSNGTLFEGIGIHSDNEPENERY